MTTYWLNIQDGSTLPSSTLPTVHDLSVSPEIRERFLASLVGRMRVRDIDGQHLMAEYTDADADAIFAVAAWLRRTGMRPWGVSFRNLRTGATTEMTGDQLISPRAVDRCKAQLRQRRENDYGFTDVLDASTPEEIHLATYWYLLHEHDAVGRSLLLVTVGTDIPPGFRGDLAREIQAEESWSWSARRLDDQRTVNWRGWLMAFLNPNLQDVTKALECRSGSRSVLVPVGVVPSAQQVSQIFDDLLCDIPGAGSGARNILIHSYGWNRVPGYPRPWELGVRAPLEVQGQPVRFT